MQKINVLLLVIILQVIRPCDLQAKLLFKSTSSSKSTKLDEAPIDKKTALLSKPQDPGLTVDKSLEGLDEESIRSSLKKYELILSREKKIENIIALEFNRIVCITQLARLTRIKSGGKKLQREERRKGRGGVGKKRTKGN